MAYLLGMFVGAILVTKIFLMILKRALPESQPGLPFLIAGGAPMFLYAFSTGSPAEAACYPLAAAFWFLIEKRRSTHS